MMAATAATPPAEVKASRKQQHQTHIWSSSQPSVERAMNASRASRHCALRDVHSVYNSPLPAAAAATSFVVSFDALHIDIFTPPNSTRASAAAAAEHPL
jgi:hypothetical protein